MKTKECKYCRSKIHEEAIRCPKCQGDLRNWFRRHPIWTGVLVIFVFISVLAYGSDSEDGASETQSDLVGNVNFTDGQFVITNQEDRNWNSCYMKVNDSYYYPSKTSDWADGQKIRIEAGQTFTIGSHEFTMNDGTRFNINDLKPQQFVISCDNGFGYWEW